ncbi:BnaC08g19960D [Brassica napus]|uniref:BnaC08g19960D protein n=2 Tax=Brassica napus TaxID=3708 RepID=A0A078HLQ0_BRANA|nr:BnaC08g19960D [Brassica napus]
MVSNDELVKQHAKVAEDAVTARWEKAGNEVVELNQMLEDAGKEDIVLQDRVKSSQWGSSVLDK